jgi:hypothetical protein
MALLAASQQFMEDISEGDDSDGAGVEVLEDGTFASNDLDSVEETEMVFNTELDAASQDYSIELPPSSDESISMIESQEPEDSHMSNEFEMSNRATVGASFRHRASFRSEVTTHSAPSRDAQDNADHAALMYETAGGKGNSSRAERRRPLSISVPDAAGAADSRYGIKQRRTSNRIVPSAIQGIGEEGAQPSHTGGSFFGRRSSRKTSQGGASNGSSDAFGNAIEKLRNKDSSSEWESVAAAVAVVQEGERRPTSSTVSRHNQFNVGDTVLVFLTLLNVTNLEDPKDTFTIAAVNSFGYPEGEGRLDEEKRGPYNFVLATVKQLHFEEDDRYYTVIRADTGSEQRADSGWMEPLKDQAGSEAAYRAAKRTFRSQSDREVEMMEDSGYIRDIFGCLMEAVAWPAYFFRNSILPGYRTMHMIAKIRVSQMLYGDSPFACRIRVTGINFLVFCSVAFLFLEVANLAFIPPHVNSQVLIVEA